MTIAEPHAPCTPHGRARDLCALCPPARTIAFEGTTADAIRTLGLRLLTGRGAEVMVDAGGALAWTNRYAPRVDSIGRGGVLRLETRVGDAMLAGGDRIVVFGPLPADGDEA